VKKFALIVILIAVVFAFQPETALAVDDTSLASWCVGYGRAWADSECTLTSYAVIMRGQSLSIAASERFTIETGGYLINKGTVTNHGTINNKYTIFNWVTIDNYGSIHNSSLSDSLVNYQGVSSLIESLDDAFFINESVLTNHCPGSYSGSPPFGNPIVESCSTIAVEIDIKPGSDENAINCRATNAVIPVAILTTDDFDAQSVDHETVKFGEASETHVSKRDGPVRHVEDVDDDGDLDLLFHFRWGETELGCDTETAGLNGTTFDEVSIYGEDHITIVPRR